MDKSPDAFRTISEVADWLGTPTHVLRFWESRFSQIKPVKRAGGRRYYRPADMELLGGIKKLLHDDGLTIRGVQKILREEGVKHVAAMSPRVDGEEPPVDLTDSMGDDDHTPELARLRAPIAPDPVLYPEAKAPNAPSGSALDGSEAESVVDASADMAPADLDAPADTTAERAQPVFSDPEPAQPEPEPGFDLASPVETPDPLTAEQPSDPAPSTLFGTPEETFEHADSALPEPEPEPEPGQSGAESQVETTGTEPDAPELPFQDKTELGVETEAKAEAPEDNAEPLDAMPIPQPTAESITEDDTPFAVETAEEPEVAFDAPVISFRGRSAQPKAEADAATSPEPTAEAETVPPEPVDGSNDTKTSPASDQAIPSDADPEPAAQKPHQTEPEPDASHLVDDVLSLLRAGARPAAADTAPLVQRLQELRARMEASNR